MVIKFGKWLTRHKSSCPDYRIFIVNPATIGYVSTQLTMTC